MLAKLNSTILRAACAFREGVARRWPGIGDRFKGARAVYDAAFGLFLRTASSDGMMLVEVDGSRMLLPKKYAGWYAVAGYEKLTFPRFKDAVKPGAVVVDVGAHVGGYALAASRLAGPSGRVFALEPDPENFALLEKNLGLNRRANVVALRVAAGARPGKRSFNLADSSDSNSFYAHPMAGRKAVVEVDCVTVDDVARGAKVDVVKIDVEGAEPEVLDGMRETLEGNPGLVLFVEFNPCCLRLGGHDPRALLERLRGLGFSMTLLDERAGVARPFEPSSDFPGDRPEFYANLHCARRTA